MTLTPTPCTTDQSAPGPLEGSEKWAASQEFASPPEAEFAQGPEISLLEGLWQNLPVVFPCVPPCWDQEAGGQDQVEEIRRALALPTGHPGSVLGCLPPQAECSLAQSRGAPLPRSRGLVWLCPPLMRPSIGTYSSNQAGQLTCKCLHLYLHCGQPCCSIAFLKICL